MHRTPSPRLPAALLRPSALAAALAWGLVCAAPPAAAAVVISQVYGGNGVAYANDYVELFNNGSSAVSVAGWSIQYASATGSGNFSSNGISALSGSIEPGRYLLVKLASASGGAALPTPNLSGASSTNLSGTNGKVVLVNTATGLACNGGSTPCDATQTAQIVDLVGYGTANFFEGTAAPAASSSTALLRANAGCTDTQNNSADFVTGTPAPRTSDTAAYLCGGPPPAGEIVPSCANLSLNAGSAGAQTLTATDSDSIVNAASITAGALAGITLGSLSPAAAEGGNASVALNVANTLAVGSYPLTVQFSNDDGQTASCSLSVNVLSNGYTPTFSIQGDGNTSPLVTQKVTTRGVVTKVNNNGFYIQDASGDGNPDTSDGLFVFATPGSYPAVALGNLVSVAGTVAEFNTGAASNATTLAHTVTELSSVTAVALVSSGHSITPAVVAFPEAVNDDLEKVEGMLVTLEGPLTVQQNYFHARYGQLTLAANGRLETPTNRYRPGTTQAQALADENARRRILLDDGSSAQNPNPTPYFYPNGVPRGGDTVASVTGVIDYGLATSSNTGLGDYKIHPTVAPVFSASHPRPATPPAALGDITVASFNVLNYFTTFTDGATASGGSGQGCTQDGASAAGNCRGADNLAEFTRQQAKIVAAISALNADALGLMEMQNNGNTAVNNLVAALNAQMGAGTYASVALPADTGSDAIRVAMIYKPAKLSPVGSPLSDTDAVNSRPTLAQTFALVGNSSQKFALVVNHFKSKGSCPDAGDSDYAGNFDAGDGQGCWNALRLAQAQRLRSFIADVQSSGGTSHVLVVGDLNAYGQEDPVHDLTSNGYTDQISRFVPVLGYSYVFDGAAGRLDHALTSASLSTKVASTAHWHINADEGLSHDYNTEFKAPATTCGTGGSSLCPADPYSAHAYRSSDHDPVLIGLNFSGNPTPQQLQFTDLPTLQADGTLQINASASSGLAPVYTSLTPAVCTVSGTLVQVISAGTCTLQASQSGNADYAAATTVTQSFAVNAEGQVEGEVPLPLWALGLLGGGLAAAMRRARKPGNAH